MYECCRYSTEDIVRISEHKLHFHIPAVFKINFLCWKCGLYVTKRKTQKHNKKCTQAQRSLPTKEQLQDTYTQCLIQAIKAIIQLLQLQDFTALLQTSIAFTDHTEWFLPYEQYISPTQNYLQPAANHFNVSLTTLHNFIQPIKIFNFSKRIGTLGLTNLSQSLSNVITQYHTQSTIIANPPLQETIPNPALQKTTSTKTSQEPTSPTPSTSNTQQPLKDFNKKVNPQINIVGHSRIVRYHESEPNFKIKAEKGAKLHEFQSMLYGIAAKLPDNKINPIYVVDPINNITKFKPNKTYGIPELSIDPAATVDTILTKLTELKKNAPRNVNIIFATIVPPELHRYNSKRNPRKHKLTQDQIKEENRKTENLIEEINSKIIEINLPYTTPKIHVYKETTDGLHPNFHAIKNITLYFKAIHKKNVEIANKQ